MDEPIGCPLCGLGVETFTYCIEPGWWVGEILCLGHRTGDCSMRMTCSGDTEDEALANVIAAWNVRNDD